MNRRLVGMCTIVVLAALIGGVLTGAAAGDGETTEADTPLGAEISSFMQTSSVETADGVEDGRFEIAMNSTDDLEERRSLIEARHSRLEARSERLHAQHERLGETPDIRNRSLATRIAVGSTGLEHSLNGTERAAAESGVDTDRLAELRSDARTLRGPDVARLARGLAGPPNADSPTPRSPTDDGGSTDARDVERDDPPAAESSEIGPDRDVDNDDDDSTAPSTDAETSGPPDGVPSGDRGR